MDRPAGKSGTFGAVGSSDEFDIARLKQAPERVEDRTSMFLQAQLEPEDGRAAELCRVRNVSAGGVMCETQRTHSSGERVQVTLRSVGRVGATVVWTSSNRVGLSFDAPIDPRDLRMPVGTRSAG